VGYYDYYTMTCIGLDASKIIKFGNFIPKCVYIPEIKVITIGKDMFVIHNELLGEGKSGKVHLGEIVDGSNVVKVAIKIAHENSRFSLEEEYNNAKRLKEVLQTTAIKEHFCYPLTITPEKHLVYPLLKGHTFANERNNDVLYRTLISVCTILRTLWEKGITHRDIYPENIMLVNNVPVFIDLAHVEINGGNSNIARDIQGYMKLIEYVTKTLYQKDEEHELQSTLRYIYVQRLDPMCSVLNRSYFRYWMLFRLMDEIESYLNMFIRVVDYASVPPLILERS